jgi:hypothetical protein
MLSDAMQIPFPMHKPLTRKPALVHGHFLNRTGLKNVFVLWRDPRNIFVSYYFHCYFKNEHYNSVLVERMKKALPFSDYQNIYDNLPEFINFLCERPISPNYTWMDFVTNWHGQAGIIEGKYEDFRKDTMESLEKVVYKFSEGRPSERNLQAIIDRYDFDKMKAAADLSIKKSGTQVKSFIREGSIDGWKAHFSKDSQELVEKNCSRQMVSLGYLT